MTMTIQGIGSFIVLRDFEDVLVGSIGVIIGFRKPCYEVASTMS